MYKRHRRSLSVILKVIVSITIFTIVFKRVTNQESLDLIQILTAPLLFVITVTGILQKMVIVLIQRKLLKMFNFFFPFASLIIHNFISSMYLLILPGFFAPDFYLGYYYGKEKKEYKKVVYILLINRIVGFSAFLFLAVIALLILGNTIFREFAFKMGDFNNKIIFFGIPMALILALLIFNFRKKIVKIKEKLIFIMEEIKKNKTIILQAIILKFGFNIVGLSGRIAIGILLGITLPFMEFAATILILNLLISLPISLNGIGVREAGYVGLLTILGVPSNLALSFALCEFGITLSVAFIGALFFASRSMTQLNLK